MPDEPIKKESRTKLGVWTHITSERPEDEPCSYITRTVRTDYTIRHGAAVVTVLVFAGEEEPDPDAIVAADVTVVAVVPERLAVFGETPCLVLGDDPAGPHRYGVPVENLVYVGDEQDAPDDLATDRWFPTEEEADDHADYVRRELRRRGLRVDE